MYLNKTRKFIGVEFFKVKFKYIYLTRKKICAYSKKHFE